MIYVLAGEDSGSKETELKKIKEGFLFKDSEQFDLDVFYAKELLLPVLQERMLALPLKSKRRIIIVREAHNLKADIKEYLLKYATAPYPTSVLILDMPGIEAKDGFINGVSKYIRLIQFKQQAPLNTFVLGRHIEAKKTRQALYVLARLLKSGEKPERILGGLRYAFEKNNILPREIKKRMKALLDCDTDIKTGKFKADFALENLVIALCGFNDSVRQT